MPGSLKELGEGLAAGDLAAEALNELAALRIRTLDPSLRAILHLDRPLPWHLDGEPAPARQRAELTVEPRALRMQVTGDCPWT